METVMSAAGSGLALRAGGASTFFVPTDEAFRALGQDRLNMLSDDVQALTQVRPCVLDSQSFCTVHALILGMSYSTCLKYS